jgi:hypothetical protein
MAKRTQPKSSGVAEDPLVASLVPDPSQGPPNTSVLAGYLGRGTEEGVLRLYLTPDLNEYVEISEDDILHRVSLPNDRGTQIWVRNDLDVRYVRSLAQRVPAGQIGSRAYPRTLAGSPRIRPMGGPARAGGPAVAEAMPFTLATAHHAITQPGGTTGYKNWIADAKKVRDDMKPPWTEGHADILGPLTVQYEQLLTEYLDLVAAYEELRQSRG